MQRNGRRGAARSRRTARSPDSEGDVFDIEAARSIELRGHLVGRLVRWVDDKPQVDFSGNPHGPIFARSTVPLAELPREASRPVRPGPEVLLVFDGQRSYRPVIVGVLADAAHAQAPQRIRNADRLDREILSHRPQRPGPGTGGDEEKEEEELLITRRRIVFEGTTEVVLRSGNASITLRKNGRLVQRGTYLESHSKGVNRIKGGLVKLN